MSDWLDNVGIFTSAEEGELEEAKQLGEAKKGLESAGMTPTP